MQPASVVTSSLSPPPACVQPEQASAQNMVDACPKSSWQLLASSASSVSPACGNNFYSLKCLSETVNSLSDLSITHLGSPPPPPALLEASGEMPPIVKAAADTQVTISQDEGKASHSRETTKEIEAEQELAPSSPMAAAVPCDHVVIRAVPPTSNPAILPATINADCGTFFLLTRLDNVSPPTERKKMSCNGPSDEPLASLNLQTSSLDALEQTGGGLNLPHLEDGLSSGDEGEFDSEEGESNEMYHVNGGGNGAGGCESGLLSRKLMQDITQDIEDIKKVIVDNRDLPPVIPRSHALSTQPPLIENSSQQKAHTFNDNRQQFAQFPAAAFPSFSHQSSVSQNIQSANIPPQQQQQFHPHGAWGEEFGKYWSEVNDAAYYSSQPMMKVPPTTGLNQLPQQQHQQQATPSSIGSNGAGPHNTVTRACVHRESEYSVGSGNTANNLPIHTGARQQPVVNHQARSSRSKLHHQTASSKKGNKLSTKQQEAPLEAQHWTFPHVSHTLYSSSSSGGEMEDDEEFDESGSEEPSVGERADVEAASHETTTRTSRHTGNRRSHDVTYSLSREPPSRQQTSLPSSTTSSATAQHQVQQSSTISHPSVPRPIKPPSSMSTITSETADYESDEDTAKLLNKSYQKEQSMDIPELRKEREIQCAKQRRGREVAVRHPERPSHLIEGALFRVMYLGSTQLFCDSQPSKATRLLQAQEAVGRIKVSENEFQPCTPVDLFVSTEKLIVLNTNLREIVMDYALRTISYIADIGDLLVLMARPTTLSPQHTPGDCDAGRDGVSPTHEGGTNTSSSDSSHMDEDGEDTHSRHGVCVHQQTSSQQNKIICHVFESAEAQMIAQCIGKAFQAAYIEFLRANGIDDPNMFKEMDYQEVLNQQELYGDELHLFANREMQKEIVISKHHGEALGVVIVESGWGSMVPTVMLASMNPTGPAARCGLLNIGNQIISVNGHSVVGLPLTMCQQIIKNCKPHTNVKVSLVCSSPVVEVLIRRPDAKYQLGFSVQNGVICSLLRGGIAERGGIRVGHRIIEINGQSVVAVPHERIVHLLATAVGEIHLRTMPTSIFRLLTGQETPNFI